MAAANTQNCSKPHTIETVRYNCERDDRFMYLGSLVTGNNNVSKEITNCLIQLLIYHVLDCLSHRKTKIILYKITVRPILTYATETWTITKKMKED
jgi:hypothetical protein